MPMSTTKRRAPAKLAAPVVKSTAKRLAKTTIDETRTSVSGTDALQSSQVEAIEISSDPDSDEDISDADDNDESNGSAEDSKPVAASLAHVNGKQNPSKDEADDAGSDAEATSPSFGELLRGNEAIDVTAMLQQSTSDNSAVARTARTAISAPTHQSLTTVLSQALQTDDTDLLESCLHTTNLPTIRNTIERIDSSLAGILLTKLAARLHRRPGRAGTLMTWVQWTLIAHGGALASQPKVIQNLHSLQKVLAERAKGLNSLLALKGKLDILEGQMELRRKMQRSSGHIQQDEDDADEEDVIYVEGEDEAEQKDLANGIRSRRRRAGADDDEDDAIVANGFIGDSEDEEEDSAEEDEDSDDAEEPLDEDEVDYDDVDESMGEDEESDVEVAPPSKVQKVARAFGKKK